MLFSDYYDIEITEKENWFDPILNHDTKLFVDPFLIFQSNLNDFKGSHEKLVGFFNDAFKIAAVSTGNRNDLRYKQLLNICRLKEAQEVCLGYSSKKGVDGSGSGSGYSKKIVEAIFESIRYGIKELNHFEEIGLFNEGFGCDRISDGTIQILKQEFILYTQQICKKHKIELKSLPILVFNYRFKRWEVKTEKLPQNPFFENRPVLLVPEEFLRNLPTLDKEEFWDYCWENHNEALRNDFNVLVKNDVNRADIIELAKANRNWVDEFIKFREQVSKPKPYNLETDPKGVYKWIYATKDFADSNPISLSATDAKKFENAVSKIISQFSLFIEQNKGYKLLWNEKPESPKSEEAAQLLFLGIVKQYCKQNDIDISKEVDIGRGPVDFKFSKGYSNRALIELKLAKSSKFWQNLKNQLPIYLHGEEVDLGYFIIICYTQKDFLRLKGIQKIIDEAGKKYQVRMNVIVVDATSDKPSASKVK